MPYIASMGIYVFKKSVMEKLLTQDFPTANDFGGEVIPGAKDKGYKVQAYLFQGYWEDIGTIESFYLANLALTDQPNPKARPLFALLFGECIRPPRRRENEQLITAHSLISRSSPSPVSSSPSTIGRRPSTRSRASCRRPSWWTAT